MDDVEAELDDLRLQSFLDHLGLRTQTILTSAKGHVLPDLASTPASFECMRGGFTPRPGESPPPFLKVTVNSQIQKR